MDNITSTQYPRSRRLTQMIAEGQRKEICQILADAGGLLRQGAPTADLLEAKHGRPAGKVVDDFLGTARKVLSAKPFGSTNGDIRLPEVSSWLLEIQPFCYSHTIVGTSNSQKQVRVMSRLKWVVTLADYGLEPLRVILAQRDTPYEAFRRYVGHAVLISMALNQPNVKRLVEGLRYAVTSTTTEEFGALPLTIVSSSLPTMRPPDQVITDITEMSGIDQIEEVLDCDGVRDIRDPLRERVKGLIESFESAQAAA
jgi:hypothetical protein